MASGKASERKRKKRKERERRIARERNLRRNAPTQIQDLPADDAEEDEGDDLDPPEQVPCFDTERLFRHIARRTCSAVPEERQSLSEVVESARGRRVDELVSEIPQDSYEDQSQELAFQAMEADEPEEAGRLARRALELDPECADALCVLALQRDDPKERLDCLTEAVEAAERSLRRPSHGVSAANEFYAEVYRRPCERAHTRLAETLVEQGRIEEAATQFGLMIDLDLNDSQSMRFPLVLMLLERGDAAGARRILNRFPWDKTSLFAWARVLERFLAGDRAEASRALRRARKSSSEVEVMLLEEVLPCVDTDDYHFDEDDKADVVALLLRAWLPHRNALHWLEKGGPATTPEERRLAVGSYSAPAAALLTKGEPAYGGAWRDGTARGFGAEHAPELLRMATDTALHECQSDSTEVWGPVHAWRALAHLGAVEAIPALAALLRERHDDEWVLDDMTWVFIELGPPALPAMMELLADLEADDDPRGVAAEAMRGIVKEHPECRAEVVASLMGVLEENWEEESPYMNASLVSDLVMLRAREAGPLIRQVYEEEMVDEGLAGSWEHVQVDLDLDESGNPR